MLPHLLSLGPKGLGRPFTARNRPVTACLATRRENVQRSMSRLESLVARQDHQLLLEKLRLRDQHIPLTPDEMRMRTLNERIAARRLREQRAAEVQARAAKAEAARLTAEREAKVASERARIQDDKAEKIKETKRKLEADKHAKMAKGKERAGQARSSEDANMFQALKLDETSNASIPDQIISFIKQNSTRVMDLFKQFDDDGSGKINDEEFIKAMMELGLDVDAYTLAGIFM